MFGDTSMIIKAFLVLTLSLFIVFVVVLLLLTTLIRPSASLSGIDEEQETLME
jgi:Trk-type K+ transport system membrane component